VCFLMKNLSSKYGYSELGAKEVCIYVVDRPGENIFRRIVWKTGKDQNFSMLSAKDGSCSNFLANLIHLATIALTASCNAYDLIGFSNRHVISEATHILTMSAYGTINTAIEAMKLGAYDYISKPFKTDEVLLILRKAEERENLRQENRWLKERIRNIEDNYNFGKMIAKSEVMQSIFKLSSKAAQHNTTVLISGESGTGKELIARGIHFGGARSKMPFIAVNCGGIPENLLESELFGHKKGAFTGADRDRKGLFEEAEGGTIFLDEIGELPLVLQVKLLRVLQEREIRPIGDSKVKSIDVRFIAATAKQLADEVTKGSFREDLFYRLNVLPIKLPLLKDRPEDIPPFMRTFY